MMRRALVESRKADLVERMVHHALNLELVLAELPGTEGDILEHGRTEKLIVGILEEQAHRAADRCQVWGRYGLAEDEPGCRARLLPAESR